MPCSCRRWCVVRLPCGTDFGGRSAILIILAAEFKQFSQISFRQAFFPHQINCPRFETGFLSERIDNGRFKLDRGLQKLVRLPSQRVEQD